MRGLRGITALVALMALVVASVAAGASGRGNGAWKVRDLGQPRGVWSYAVAVNDGGQVIGNAYPRDRVRAFLWENGKPRAIGGSDGRQTEAVAINDRGQVVGNAYEAGDSLRAGPRAFLSEGGRLVRLGSLGGGASSAVAINEKGQVVGWSLTASGARHAFLWQAGKMTDLGVLPGGGWSVAVDVNERGQVVGQSDSKVKQDYATVNMNLTPGRAFLWERGTMTDLGTVSRADRNSDAVAINERGTVLAYSWHTVRDLDEEQYDTDYTHAFLWAGGKRTAVRGLGGYPNSMPSALNERGQVVGCAVGAAGFYYDQTEGYTPFRWHGGRMLDLGTLPGDLFGSDPGDLFGCADAINERGVVVGTSEWTAFVWEQGALRPLPPLPGDQSSDPADVNDAGVVVGSSGPAYGEDGNDRAVLWTKSGS